MLDFAELITKKGLPASKRNQRGQTTTEWALIMTFIAVVTVALMNSLMPAIVETYQHVDGEMTKAQTAGTIGQTDDGTSADSSSTGQTSNDGTAGDPSGGNESNEPDTGFGPTGVPVN